MKYRIITAIAIIALLGMGFQNAMAQEKKPKSKSGMDSDVKGKSEKMTIVIDGDNITINGKPITEYDGDNIVIRKKNLEGALAPYAYAEPRIRVSPRVAAPRVYPSPPRFNFSFDDEFISESKPRAQLGVVTEKDEKGVKIKEVMKESAAEKGGLKEGDVITAVDGKKMADPDDLADVIGDKKPGQETTINYLRAKKSQKLIVKLGEQKIVTRTITRTAPGHREHYYSDLERLNDLAPVFQEAMPRMHWKGDGFTFSSTPRLGIRIEDTEEGKGARVLYVEEGSVGEKAGIRKDDIISSIDSMDIKDTNDARRALSETHGKQIFPLVVNRNGSPVKIEVKIPKTLRKTDL